MFAHLIKSLILKQLVLKISFDRIGFSKHVPLKDFKLLSLY